MILREVFTTVIVTVIITYIVVNLIHDADHANKELEIYKARHGYAEYPAHEVPHQKPSKKG